MRATVAQQMTPSWVEMHEPELVDAPSVSTPSDETLYSRFIAGDTNAFESLFERHYGHIHQVLYHLVGDQADDYCQQVFLRLYQHPPRDGTHLRAWLARVATNLGLNAIRGRKRWHRWRDELAYQTEGAGWLSKPRDPKDSSAQSARQANVRQILSSLSRRQAAILALRYSGYRYAEIARTLGVAPGSVGTMLARAEKAFAERYRQEFGQD